MTNKIIDPFFWFIAWSFFLGSSLLADPNTLAKAYFFYFVVLFFPLYLIRNQSDVDVPHVFLWWLGFVAFFGLSAFFSSDSASALIHFVYMFVAGVFLLLVRNRAIKNYSFIDNAAWLLVLVAVLYAVLGLYQYHDFLLYGKRTSMLIPSFLPPTDARVSGPFGQPNFQATVMLIGLYCMAYLYKLRLAAMSQRERWGVALISVLLLLNFFLANSRAGYLSLIIAIARLYVYARYRYRLNREYVFSKKQVAATAVLFVVAWALYWLLITVIAPFLGDAALPQEVLREGGIQVRLNMWVAAILMAVDYPLLGVGLDNYKTHLAEYQIRAHGLTNFYYEDLIYTHWAHNEYLQILAEGGILGFAAMMGFLVSAGRGIWRNLKTTAPPFFVFVPLALVPLLVHGGFEWPLRSAPFLATFLLLIAISLPPTARGYRLSLATPLRKGFLSIACLGLIGVGTWALYWDMEAGVLKRHTGDERFFEHNLKRLERLADHPVTALTILRQGMYPYLNHAVRENDVELARYLVPILERIIPLEGASWQWHNLARLQLVAGYLDDAHVSVEKAIHLNPIHEPSWELLRHLNRLNAVEQTGRPMESFLPPQAPQPSLGRYETHPLLF